MALRRGADGSGATMRETQGAHEPRCIVAGQAAGNIVGG